MHRTLNPGREVQLLYGSYLLYMKRLYKYHVRLYRLYEVFGEKIFYGREAEEALKTNPYVYPNSLVLTGLDRKKLIETPPRDEVRKEIDRPDFRKHYRRLSESGLEISRFIEKNKRILTMFLLRN